MMTFSHLHEPDALLYPESSESERIDFDVDDTTAAAIAMPAAPKKMYFRLGVGSASGSYGSCSLWYVTARLCCT